MDDNTVKKIVVVILSTIMVLSFSLPCVLCYYFNVNIVVAVILFVITLVASVKMIYVTKERLEEINGGQDDDIKHY